MEKLFIFDTSNIVYRSFFGFSGRHLTTSRGEITSGIFGTIRILIKLYNDFRFENVVFSLDGPREKTKRYEVFKEYKMNREKAPDDLKRQIVKTIELLKTAGIECVEIPGYESDDIISVIVNNYKDKYEIYIVSGDKDLIQLLTSDNIKIISFSPAKTEYKLITRSSFIKENGFEPEYIVDYLSLIGDDVDNIPGARGIGEKTATPLIQKYKTIENIYQNLDELNESVKKKLVESKEDVFLSKTLLKLFSSTDIHIPIKKFSLENFKTPQVIKLLKDYEFNSILKELRVSSTSDEGLSLFTSQPPKEVERTFEYKLITKYSEIERLQREIESKGFVSIVIKTDDRHFMQSNLEGIGLAIDKGVGYYISLTTPSELTYDQIIQFLRRICENENIRKFGHNLKLAYVVLKRYEVELRGISFDTTIASYVLRPELTNPSLERLASEYLGIELQRPQETDGQISIFEEMNLEKTARKTSEEAEVVVRLSEQLSSRIENEDKLKRLFYDIEMPVVEVLGDMEYNGIKLDTEYIKRLGIELDKEINQTAERIFELAGESFNLNSPKQLSHILFEKLKLEPVKKTKTGYSTDEEVLEELVDEHEIVGHMLRYRTLMKLKSGYVDELPSMVIPKTGRVHTSFNQTITATGRLSSSNPNLQNIPIRDEIGKKIRKAFVAEDGFLLGSFDYSQIELRVLADVSQDKELITHFIEDKDIHTETASKVLKIKIEDVTPEHRRLGKTINFGIVYGISPYGLSKQLGISSSEASEIIEKYFETYSGVKEYIFRTLEFASLNGYVETMFGRRRSIPELLGKSFEKDKLNFGKPERIAINTPIQGSAAEIVKIAMVKLHKFLKNTPIKMLLQVHDEILIEIPSGSEEEWSPKIKQILENAVKLKVPLVVDYGFGKSWGDI